ncbi:FkbM family methyltransferase [Gaetbulibacter aquiaggeris]|uniref:FkbM family methyltransferase n=1 Tax=Gaetbulibacter aquiaggeris TaxID=1735373 RepID=A0ABW7MSH0_9FLAO
MSLYSTLKFIANHPLNGNNKLGTIIRFFKWQINTRLNPYPILYQYTTKSKLIIEKGMTGATGNLYCGLHEFNDMAFVLHFLRPDDLFVDIGANIGSYTILGAVHVGSKTISIEPVPSTFSKLLNNISINNAQNNVIAKNIALGSKKENVAFTKSLDTTNHVATASDKDIIEVNVETLDELLSNNITPSLMKIDVEGFETEVIKGALKTLNNHSLKAIIIELNGSGKRYGYDELEIHKTLLANGFIPYLYEPFNREIIKMEGFGTQNTIYIRDIQFVNERLKGAEKIEILKHTF